MSLRDQRYASLRVIQVLMFPCIRGNAQSRRLLPDSLNIHQLQDRSRQTPSDGQPGVPHAHGRDLHRVNGEIELEC